MMYERLCETLSYLPYGLREALISNVVVGNLSETAAEIAGLNIQRHLNKISQYNVGFIDGDGI